MTINFRKGEASIRLDGIDYVLRPSFAALSSIEQELQQSIITLSYKLADKKLALQELSVIIRHCMCHGANAQFVQAALIRNGMTTAYEAAVAVFVIALGGYSEDAA